MDVPAFYGAPQRGARRQQPTLPHHVFQCARAHAFGERTQRIAARVQQA
jgi:hypothetical protein